GRGGVWMAGRGSVLAGGRGVGEVNAAGVSIGDEGLVAELAYGLEVAGEGARRVIFEVTETAAIENLDAARAFADRVAALGCRFALDDFGTGFGSVTYLRHLPVDYLKIDTRFVQGASERPEDL